MSPLQADVYFRTKCWQQPLYSGGLLSGNVKAKDAPVEKGSRYDPETNAGKIMRKFFLSGTEMEAVDYLTEVIVSISAS